MMNLSINNILAGIFYVLFFVWIFVKIRNFILINRLHCKESYKKIKKRLTGNKPFKYLFLISIIILVIILLATFLGSTFMTLILALLLMFITLGGTYYADTGNDSTDFNNFMQSSGDSLDIFKYISYGLYIIIYILLIRSIHINISIYNSLKNGQGLSDDVGKDTNICEQPQKGNDVDDQSVENKSKKKNLILIIGIVAIVIVFIACFSFFINFMNNVTSIH